ncbi:hypothetical protein [Mucilaginibacter sp.]
MKTLRSIAFIGLMAGALFSCNKNNYNTQPNTNATDEAADLVTASISANSQGSLNGFSDMTLSSETKIKIDSVCGTVWTDSVNRSIPFTTTGSYGYSYKANYTYALNCTNGVFNHSSTSTSTYSGSVRNAILSSTFTGSSNITISGLGVSYPAYIINGNYTRSGSFQSQTDTSYHGTHTISLTLTNVTLTKPLEVLQSGGSASFTITGNMPSKGGAFSSTGSIVFNGGYNATLTVNGIVYSINLQTGTKIKK